MVGFSVLDFNQHQNNQTWFIIWLSSAVLINPIFKISLGRELWNIVDVVWAILLEGIAKESESQPDGVL
jgi:hypothetical protein